MRREAAVVLAVAAAVFLTSPAAAQSADAPQAGRFEVSVGALWAGRASFGGADATETAPTGARYSLFTTSTELAPALGAEVRVGVRVTRLLQAEATGSYSRPELRTRVSADAEQALPVTATERVQQVTAGGALVLYLPWRVGSRGAPFLTGGAAYLRQLHEGLTLIQSGQAYYLGGGLKFRFTASRGGRVKGFGLRTDVRALGRSKAVNLDGRTHVVPAIAASFFVEF